MKRTTVMIEESTYARLRAIARRRGVPTSSTIREALGEYVAANASSVEQPLAALTGLFDGPPDALGRRLREIVAEEVGVKHALDRGGAGVTSKRARKTVADGAGTEPAQRRGDDSPRG